VRPINSDGSRVDGPAFGRAFHQNALHRSHALLTNRFDVGVDDGLQLVQAAQFHVAGRLVVQVGGGRARAGAEDEAEGVVEADVVDQLHHPGEIIFGLAGETDDKVAAHRQIGPDGAQLLHRAPVFHSGVAALHRHQDAV
jgi:hypothetical protein